MSLDILPDHLRRPHVRGFQPLAVMHNGQQLVLLRDPMMLTTQSMVVPPPAAALIQQMQGERSVEDLAKAVNAPTVDPLVELVKQLDAVGLLWGPTFDRLEAELKEKLLEVGYFPGGGGMGQPEADAMRKALGEWLAQTEDPELEGSPVGVVAPHLDYPRGWPNYAGAYKCLDGAAAPDRVVVLGTNHFGIGDGVVATQLGFETPMGKVPADGTVVDGLIRRLGHSVVIDQLDHHGEHSIKLQVPWIQQRFGDIPVIAALIPDPLIGMIADDGKRVSVDAFIQAMRDVLDEAGGRTLFVSSADMSHIGPQFGEPRPVDQQRRTDVERVDRDLMGAFLSGDPQQFLERARQLRNPTRWCSIGSLYATLSLARPERVELIDYRQACDERNSALVSSAAMAMLSG
jgi:hypothetical protein